MNARFARPIALSGPMGTGKTTVGRALAGRVGGRFVDLDAEIERAEGCSIAELFAEDGEARFRDLEAHAIDRVLRDLGSNEGDTQLVIALGGGAVTRAETRRKLLHRAIVVTLRAPPASIVARLGVAGLARRPLLRASADPIASLTQLTSARADAYAEAHAQLDTDGREVDDVAQELEALWARDPVAVPLGARTYRVEASSGALTQLPAAIDALAPTALLLVTDDRVWPAVSARIEPALARATSARVPYARVILPSGEVHKTLAAVERIWDASLEGRLDRRAVIVAIGGGVVGDVAGFAAATLLRGVRVVQVPTTLLAMVDASVGGKTAIDRPQGKNLIGAFHQPSAVIADVSLLDTLPSRELRSGLAEAVKTGLIGDVALFEAIERDAELLAMGPVDAASARALSSIVRASIAHKARVVGEDERDESGARAALNFGHTVGHALEAHGGYSSLTHGEAVGLGMIAALKVGVARGVTDARLVDRLVRLLARLGLPHALDEVDVAGALPFVLADKKREGGKLSFVLVPEVGRSCIERIEHAELRRLVAG